MSDPAYSRLHARGELQARGRLLWQMMEHCRLCPRECGVNRLQGERGVCRATAELEIAACHPHFGEEQPLVGTGGSGTIFLSHCNLNCVFCINWEISHGAAGRPSTIGELARMMLELQKLGCHNINLVSPTHYSPHIVLALDRAAAQGLRVPLVYNTSGWEESAVLQLLDGVVDIYLADFKFARRASSAEYASGADTYPETTRRALVEMHRQVGVARPGGRGVIERGLMIRHLVMPNDAAGSKEVFAWIARTLSPDTYVNVMSQYRPAFRASEYPAISRRPTREEFSTAVLWAREAGLINLDIQAGD